MQTGKIVIIIISCDDKSLDAVSLPFIRIVGKCTPKTCNANIYEVVDNVFQYNNVTTCYKKQFSIFHDFS